ncbi:MAG: hypothetical protein IIY54_10680 [Ruminococcus sp.]|nr:hypothetical protein [Ruminococcus sp.]MBQ1310163.1 hypothetical protein [Ruminococcus sp.]
MTNEERKTAILELWHDIATDRSLQVGLRLKASEYEAKALGLIGDQPGIATTNEPDAVTDQLRRLTIEQLEAIAAASDAEIVTPKKTTAPKPVGATKPNKNDRTTISEDKTQPEASKAANTQKAQNEGKK